MKGNVHKWRPTIFDPKDATEIIVLGTSFAFILHGKSETSSISFHQSKYSYIFELCHIRIAKTDKPSIMVHFNAFWGRIIKIYDATNMPEQFFFVSNFKNMPF